MVAARRLQVTCILYCSLSVSRPNGLGKGLRPMLSREIDMPEDVRRAVAAELEAMEEEEGEDDEEEEEEEYEDEDEDE